MSWNSTQPNLFASEEVRALTDYELEEVGGGCFPLIVAAVAGFVGGAYVGCMVAAVTKMMKD